MYIINVNTARAVTTIGAHAYNVVRACSALAIALVAPAVTPSLQELAASKAPKRQTCPPPT